MRITVSALNRCARFNFSHIISPQKDNTEKVKDNRFSGNTKISERLISCVVDSLNIYHWVHDTSQTSSRGKILNHNFYTSYCISKRSRGKSFWVNPPISFSKSFWFQRPLVVECGCNSGRHCWGFLDWGDWIHAFLCPVWLSLAFSSWQCLTLAGASWWVLVVEDQARDPSLHR